MKGFWNLKEKWKLIWHEEFIHKMLNHFQEYPKKDANTIIIIIIIIGLN